jgi:hypothetical protein
MNADDNLIYPLVPVFDHRWLRLKGEVMLELAQGLKGRMRWYFEHCLGIPWKAVVFDSAYFAEKMRKARQRQNEAQERRHSLVPNREELQTMTAGIDEKDFGLIDDLFADQNNSLGLSRELFLAFYSRADYDFEKHKKVILSSISYTESKFNDLPKVVAQDGKLNRIFNFITVIFLQHYRLISVRQSPPDMEIWIKKNEYINIADKIWD